MHAAVRFLAITTLQIAGVVIAFAFLATLVFDPGEWKKPNWFFDLLPLLFGIIMINALVQTLRLWRHAKRG
jgi:hypothetical protein